MLKSTPPTPPLFERLLQDALHKNNITLHASAISLLAQYLLLLTRWNTVFNLTAITHPLDMVYRHIIDSLLLLPYLSPFAHASLSERHFLDVGSGAGLP